jgi:hypothetical protein
VVRVDVDQPGVEAGKRAARATLDALDRVVAALPAAPAFAHDIATVANLDPRLAWRLLEHLAATGRACRSAGGRPADDQYSAVVLRE